MSGGPGSGGNVIAALCSLFIPGLGQLVQGRLISAVFWLLLAALAGGITWLLTLGFAPFGWIVIAICSCIHAAVYRPRD
jgi:hypothetical protein